jgi:hypothetical protein
MRSILFFTPYQPRFIPEEFSAHFQNIVSFVSDLPLEGGTISPALISVGVPGALTSALLHFARESQATPEVPLKSFYILDKLLVHHHLMREALEAGLLRSVVHYGTIFANSENYESKSDLGGWWMILQGALPASTVYYSVLVELEIQLRHVQPLVDAPEFKNSRLYHGNHAWQSFEALAQERIALMKELDAPETVSFKACDNMEVRSLLIFHCMSLIFPLVWCNQ